MSNLSPKASTSLRLTVTFVLGMVVLWLPKLVPSLPVYIGYIDEALLLIVALSNVLHVPATAVNVINALIAALQGYANPPPAPESDAAVAERAGAGAKAIASAKALLGIATMLLCFGIAGASLETVGCSPAQTQIIDSQIPSDVLADVNCVTTELLQGGLSDPAAILGECGSLLMSQLIALAEDLLAAPASLSDAAAPDAAPVATTSSVAAKPKLLPAHYANVALSSSQRARIQAIHDAAVKLVSVDAGSMGGAS
jgi:hypothetical protein